MRATADQISTIFNMWTVNTPPATRDLRFQQRSLCVSLVRSPISTGIRRISANHQARILIHVPDKILYPPQLQTFQFMQSWGFVSIPRTIAYSFPILLLILFAVSAQVALSLRCLSFFSSSLIGTHFRRLTRLDCG